MRTWKVRRWDDRPEKTVDLPLPCEHCGTEAALTVAAAPTPIAVVGSGFVFEPADYPLPKGWRPDEIECRACHHVFTGDSADVR